MAGLVKRRSGLPDLRTLSAVTHVFRRAKRGHDEANSV